MSADPIDAPDPIELLDHAYDRMLGEFRENPRPIPLSEVIGWATGGNDKGRAALLDALVWERFQQAQDAATIPGYAEFMALAHALAEQHYQRLGMEIDTVREIATMTGDYDGDGSVPFVELLRRIGWGEGTPGTGDTDAGGSHQSTDG